MEEDPEASVGMVTFSNRAEIWAQLTNNVVEKENLKLMLDSLQPYESTSIGSGKTDILNSPVNVQKTH